MMSESVLYPPVRDWLMANGYEVHVEVFDCDVVAVKDQKLTAIELKPGFTEDLISQLCARARWADFVIAAVPKHLLYYDNRSKFRYRQACYNGFGFLTINRDKARLAAKPKPQPWHWHKLREYRVKKLTGRAPAMPHEIAGLPSCRALREQRQARMIAP